MSELDELVELEELPPNPKYRRQVFSVYQDRLQAIVDSGTKKWVELGRYSTANTARVVANAFRDRLYPLPEGTTWEFDTRRYVVDQATGKRGSVLYVRNVTNEGTS